MSVPFQVTCGQLGILSSNVKRVLIFLAFATLTTGFLICRFQRGDNDSTRSVESAVAHFTESQPVAALELKHTNHPVLGATRKLTDPDEYVSLERLQQLDIDYRKIVVRHIGIKRYLASPLKGTPNLSG